MVKKVFTPATIAVLFWGTGLIIINEYYYEYLRYYHYICIILAIPWMVFDMKNKKKKDKINSTENLKFSIYRMLFVALTLIVFYFVAKQ